MTVRPNRLGGRHMAINARLILRIVPAMALAIGLAAAPIAPAAAASHPHGSVRVALLNGDQEVAAGDEDGIGIAVLRIKADEGKICYVLAVAKLDGTVAAAHIHKAPAGVNGPIVVGLTAPTGGAVVTCTTADPALVADIAANSKNYYVNVHTSVFPGGAIRGQLR
ncbi:MAG TPA: CHRD domain-containing protein [Micromonosporaceae bacterium]|nr:CHRD domain-containing protein [Micromonosporaceae bacterium]